jgi:cellulose synthase/poly-beta-1,6-N-acetylglucosamine synthase-like glycosyltransferase
MTLSQALRDISPRLNPRPTPLHSLIIYGCVLAFWVSLTSLALFERGLLAWSVGVAYVGYDTILILFVASRVLALWRPREIPPTAPATRPTLGVIIAARNEAAVIARTIDALLAQTDRADIILVADDGSDDTMGDVLAQTYGLVPPAPGTVSAPSPVAPALRWLRLPPRGKAEALNEAIAHVSTDVIVTVDADTILDRDALGIVRQAFATDPDLAVGGGVLTPVCDNTVAGRMFAFFQTYEYVRNFMSRYAWSRLESLLLVSGAFAAVRRDVLVAVGGFDPACLTEDYELMHRVHRYASDRGLPWRVTILGDAHAFTNAPGNVVPFLRQRRRWFAGFLQAQYWNRDMTGTARYGALGLVMLPVKALDTLQPIYGLTAALLLPVFLITGRTSAFVPAFGITSAKIAVDFAFYVLVILAYRRWTGNRGGARLSSALVAAIAEPFGFQILRHAGAAWGWFAFLTRDRTWGRTSRAAPSPALKPSASE